LQAANEALPELAAVPWRPRASSASLRTRGRTWTWFTVAYVVQWMLIAGVLLALEPLTAPVAAIGLAMAWIVPNLYAARGANTLRPIHARHEGSEPLAQGFLGDLLDHDRRELQRRTGLAGEARRGRAGWRGRRRCRRRSPPRASQCDGGSSRAIRRSSGSA
jgi:hypothetical protein